MKVDVEGRGVDTNSTASFGNFTAGKGSHPHCDWNRMLPPTQNVTHLPGREATPRRPFPKDTLDRLRDFLAGREGEPEVPAGEDGESPDPERRSGE
ncbi:MAG: hypothetical protein HYY18_00780 [Planctomycetes bacterium]|nr:hypothetical protein [Planctomycetota bacterium]